MSAVLSSISPALNNRIQTNSAFTFTFASTLTASTINKQNIIFEDIAGNPVNYSIEVVAGNIFVVTPVDILLANTVYEITLTTGISGPNSGSLPANKTLKLITETSESYNVFRAEDLIQNNLDVYNTSYGIFDLLDVDYLFGPKRDEFNTKFIPTDFDPITKTYSKNNSAVIELDIKNLVKEKYRKQFLADYDVFLTNIRSQNKLTLEEFNNLERFIYVNSFELATSSGLKTKIETLLKFYGFAYGKNYIDVQPDPIKPFVYHITTDIEIEHWNQTLKSLLHPIGWQEKYNEIAKNVTKGTKISEFTVNVNTSEIVLKPYSGFVEGDVVQFGSALTLATGLAENTNYYLIPVTTDVLQNGNTVTTTVPYQFYLTTERVLSLDGLSYTYGVTQLGTPSTVAITDKGSGDQFLSFAGETHKVVMNADYANSIKLVPPTLSNGDKFHLITDGTLPLGVLEDTQYYVLNSQVATNSFQVTDTLGSSTPVEIKDLGTGQFYIAQYKYLSSDMMDWGLQYLINDWFTNNGKEDTLSVLNNFKWLNEFPFTYTHAKELGVIENASRFYENGDGVGINFVEAGNNIFPVGDTTFKFAENTYDEDTTNNADGGIVEHPIVTLESETFLTTEFSFGNILIENKVDTRASTTYTDVYTFDNPNLLGPQPATPFDPNTGDGYATSEGTVDQRIFEITLDSASVSNITDFAVGSKLLFYDNVGDIVTQYPDGVTAIPGLTVTWIDKATNTIRFYNPYPESLGGAYRLNSAVSFKHKSEEIFNVVTFYVPGIFSFDLRLWNGFAEIINMKYIEPEDSEKSDKMIHTMSGYNAIIEAPLAEANYPGATPFVDTISADSLFVKKEEVRTYYGWTVTGQVNWETGNRIYRYTGTQSASTYIGSIEYSDTNGNLVVDWHDSYPNWDFTSLMPGSTKPYGYSNVDINNNKEPYWQANYNYMVGSKVIYKDTTGTEWNLECTVATYNTDSTVGDNRSSSVSNFPNTIVDGTTLTDDGDLTWIVKGEYTAFANAEITDQGNLFVAKAAPDDTFTKKITLGYNYPVFTNYTWTARNDLAYENSTSTNVTANTLEDTAATWTVNAFAGKFLYINNDTTPYTIASNTSTIITFNETNGVNIGAGYRYRVFDFVESTNNDYEITNGNTYSFFTRSTVDYSVDLLLDWLKTLVISETDFTNLIISDEKDTSTNSINITGFFSENDTIRVSTSGTFPTGSGLLINTDYTIFNLDVVNNTFQLKDAGVLVNFSDKGTGVLVLHDSIPSGLFSNYPIGNDGVDTFYLKIHGSLSRPAGATGWIDDGFTVGSNFSITNSKFNNNLFEVVGFENYGAVTNGKMVLKNTQTIKDETLVWTAQAPALIFEPNVVAEATGISARKYTTDDITPTGSVLDYDIGYDSSSPSYGFGTAGFDYGSVDFGVYPILAANGYTPPADVADNNLVLFLDTAYGTPDVNFEFEDTKMSFSTGDNVLYAESATFGTTKLPSKKKLFNISTDTISGTIAPDPYSINKITEEDTSVPFDGILVNAGNGNLTMNNGDVRVVYIDNSLVNVKLEVGGKLVFYDTLGNDLNIGNMDITKISYDPINNIGRVWIKNNTGSSHSLVNSVYVKIKSASQVNPTFINDAPNYLSFDPSTWTTVDYFNNGRHDVNTINGVIQYDFSDILINYTNQANAEYKFRCNVTFKIYDGTETDSMRILLYPGDITPSTANYDGMETIDEHIEINYHYLTTDELTHPTTGIKVALDDIVGNSSNTFELSITDTSNSQTTGLTFTKLLVLTDPGHLVFNESEISLTAYDTADSTPTTPWSIWNIGTLIESTGNTRITINNSTYNDGTFVVKDGSTNSKLILELADPITNEVLTNDTKINSTDPSQHEIYHVGGFNITG